MPLMGSIFIHKNDWNENKRKKGNRLKDQFTKSTLLHRTFCRTRVLHQ